MSEFKEKIDINKLIGAPPGYVGYDQGGRLTKWLLKNPTSIVLFDEIEKAHPEVFDLLLQLFDAGRLTDAYGVTVNCLETIFIMTSNLGAKEIQQKHQTCISDEDLLDQVQPALVAQFRPEFINRIQQTIIFYPLTQNEVQQIVILQLKEFKARAEKNSHCANLTITWDDSLVEYLTKTGYNPEKGARELARRITTSLENPLADRLIKDEVKTGDKLFITSDGSSVNIQINKD
jgi:ATP-dependent Clp protease ATP-binding subunit ClpA